MLVPRRSSARITSKLNMQSLHSNIDSNSAPERFPSTVEKDDIKEKGTLHFSWFRVDLNPAEWDILVLSTCMKLLLFPA